MEAGIKVWYNAQVCVKAAAIVAVLFSAQRWSQNCFTRNTMLGYVYRKPKAVFNMFGSGSNNWYVLSMELIQSDIT